MAILPQNTITTVLVEYKHTVVFAAFGGIAPVWKLKTENFSTLCLLRFEFYIHLVVFNKSRSCIEISGVWLEFGNHSISFGVSGQYTRSYPMVSNDGNRRARNTRQRLYRWFSQRARYERRRNNNGSNGRCSRFRVLSSTPPTGHVGERFSSDRVPSLLANVKQKNRTLPVRWMFTTIVDCIYIRIIDKYMKSVAKTASGSSNGREENSKNSDSEREHIFSVIRYTRHADEDGGGFLSFLVLRRTRSSFLSDTGPMITFIIRPRTTEHVSRHDTPTPPALQQYATATTRVVTTAGDGRCGHATRLPYSGKTMTVVKIQIREKKHRTRLSCVSWP